MEGNPSTELNPATEQLNEDLQVIDNQPVSVVDEAQSNDDQLVNLETVMNQINVAVTSTTEGQEVNQSTENKENDPVTSTDSTQITDQPVERRGRGRPRKSDTPKKLDESQLSEMDGKTDFMLVTPSLKRGRGRPPNPFKPKIPKPDVTRPRGRPRVNPPVTKPDITRPRGRPRIHPPKVPSNRGRGRPRIKPVDTKRFARPPNMTKSLQVRLVKCTVGDVRKRGRPPGAKNKSKIGMLTKEKMIKRPTGRPPKSSTVTNNESMSYQDFVRQVNEELLAINGTTNEKGQGDNDTISETGENIDEDYENFFTTSEDEENEENSRNNVYEKDIDNYIKTSGKKRGRPPGAKNKKRKDSLDTSLTSASPKRKRGRPFGSKDSRPRKHRESYGSASSGNESFDTDKQNSFKSPNKIHRGRGRPFGSKDSRPRKPYGSASSGNETFSEDEQNSSKSPMKIHRGRGRPFGSKDSRPRKPYGSASSGSETFGADEQNSHKSPMKEHRGRGRPRKNFVIDSPNKEKRGRGRPPKESYESPSPKKEGRGPGRPKKESIDSPSPKIEGRGRGRPRKDGNSPAKSAKTLQIALFSSPSRESPKKRGRPKGSLNKVKKTESPGDDNNRLSRHCKGDVSYMETVEDIVEIISDSGSDVDIQSDSDRNVYHSSDSPIKRKRGRPPLADSLKKKKMEKMQAKASSPRKDRSCKSNIDYVALAEGEEIEISSDVDSESSDVETIRVSVETEPKRGRGRPRKSGNTFPVKSPVKSNRQTIVNDGDNIAKTEKTNLHQSENSDTLSNSENNSQSTDSLTNSSQKRGRGRPKKSDQTRGRPRKYIENNDDSTDDSQTEQSNHVKKGRGRPRKILKIDDLSSDNNNADTELSASDLSSKKEKRRPGRPKKVLVTLDMTVTEEDSDDECSGISGITMEGWEGFSSSTRIGQDQTEQPRFLQPSSSVTNSGDQPIKMFVDDIITKQSSGNELPPVNNVSMQSISLLPNNVHRHIVSKPDTSSQILGVQMLPSKSVNNFNHNNDVGQTLPMVSVNFQNKPKQSMEVGAVVIKTTIPSVVTESDHLQNRVVTETIPQNSDPGQVSSIYLDMSIHS